MKKKQTKRRSPKRRHPKKKRKKQYRPAQRAPGNWPKYNAALVQRGSLTIWVDQAVLDNWLVQERSGQRGASQTYSDAAITAALTLKVVYRLPLRATEGLLASILRLMGLEHLPVPDYSTLCRRQKALKVALPHQAKGKAIHVVVDSTGCKIYGEGEWKVRQHGISKRRTWRKLHLAVDEATGQILAAVLSTNDVTDAAVLPDLLEQIAEIIKQFSADGAYDQVSCYTGLSTREEEQGHALRVTIPPRHGARIKQHGNCREKRLARDENIRRIRDAGRAQWKEESGYHRRSLVETMMFRLKSIFGDKLSARVFESQAVEAFIRCAALNRMTELGMPDSYAV